jgi:hypothetical protein
MRLVVENPRFGLDRPGHKGIDALLQDPADSPALSITSVGGKRERSHNGVLRQVHLEAIVFEGGGAA